MELNLDKYFDPTEPEARWKVRKSFMETHKHKYSEDRLDCLARVFCNIEFMGCSYNLKLMTLVQNLGNQVDAVIKYRQQKKHSKMRTFVAASDAVRHNDIKKLYINNDATLLFKSKQQPGWKGKVVIFEDTECNSTAYATCANACIKARLVMKIVQISKKKGSPAGEYALLIGTESVETCYAASEKKARELLGPKVLNLMKKYCFTIVMKNRFEGEKIERRLEKQEETCFSMPENNIGRRIMELMGWSGQGLGIRKNGIQNPIEVQENIHKLGLGSNICKNYRTHITKCLENYISQEHTHSLIFSADFTNEERKYVHEAARRLNLQSKSYGNRTNRQITVQRKLSSWELIENLLAAGDSNNKYALIKPTDL